MQHWRATCFRAVRCIELNFAGGTFTPTWKRFSLTPATHASRNAPILYCNQVDAPSEEAMMAIHSARREIFGFVSGNNKRSGRKVLRRALVGPAVQRYRPVTFDALRIDRIGLYAPAREELYRAEEVNQRLGKTRITGKMHGPPASFVDRMKLEDAAEGILDQLDWFRVEAVLPDEREARAFLSGTMGMTEAEVEHFLPQWMASIVQTARDGPMTIQGTAGVADKIDSSSTGSSGAQQHDKKGSGGRRQRSGLRTGLADKRSLLDVPRDASTATSGIDARADGAGTSGRAPGDGPVIPLSAEERAAEEAEIAEKIKPMLEKWRAEKGAEIEREFQRRAQTSG